MQAQYTRSSAVSPTDLELWGDMLMMHSERPTFEQIDSEGRFGTPGKACWAMVDCTAVNVRCEAVIQWWW